MKSGELYFALQGNIVVYKLTIVLTAGYKPTVD